jgi:hypothetical protein
MKQLLRNNSIKLKRSCLGVLVCALCATASLSASAQTINSQKDFLRTDDQDFRIIPPPSEIITWGIGVFAVGKASLNVDPFAPKSPKISFSSTWYRKSNGEETEQTGVALRPVIDYGLTVSVPGIVNVFNLPIGLNVDAFLATYRMGTQYRMQNILPTDIYAEYAKDNKNISKDKNDETFLNNVFPTFFTTLRYLNVAPMLSIGRYFLAGVNIGVPLRSLPAVQSAPTSEILSLSSLPREIPFDKLSVIVEPRLSFLFPILSSPTGTLNLLASASWIPQNSSPVWLDVEQYSANELIKAINAWSAKKTPALQPNVQAKDLQAGMTPVSASIGLSYVFSFSNNALLEEFAREAYRTDSIRAVYAAVFSKGDSLRAVSVRLADSVANATIVLSRMRETLARLQQSRTLDSLKKAQERALFANQEQLAAAQAQKDSLDKQKRDLERANKTQTKELAAKVREVKEKENLIASKIKELTDQQKLLADTKQRIFEAKIGSVVGINEDGTETPENPIVRVEQFRASNTKVLMPTVFFDQGSSLLPARYKQIRASDRETYSLPASSRQTGVALHEHILNIVAKRLLQQSSAKLTLTGYQSPKEADAQLAKKRAEKVASYFMDVWKIPTNRLIRTTAKADASLAENTAVRLSSDEASILAPYTLADTARTVTPPALAIGLNISSGAGLKQWQLEISQIIDNESEALKDTTATEIATRYLWRVGEDAASTPRSESSLSIRLEAFDVGNTKAESPLKEVKVEQITLAQKQRAQASSASPATDKTVFVYELLYGELMTKLTPQSAALMEEIKSRITPDAIVHITAYNPQGVSGVARDIGILLGMNAERLGAANTKLGDTSARLYSAKTPEAAAYNNVIRVRITAPDK